MKKMSGSEGRSLAKDFHNLMRNIHGLSGGQVSVKDWEDDLNSINVVVKPSDGLYKGGEFNFKILPNGDCNDSPPRVYCETMIYHPNMDTLEDDGEICLNLLEEDVWESHMGLEDVIQGILFLFYNPNLEDPLTCVFSPDMSEEEFSANVRLSLKGGVVEGYTFPKPSVMNGAADVCEGETKESDDEKLGDKDCTDNDNESMNRVIAKTEQVEVPDTECNIIEEDEGTCLDTAYQMSHPTADTKVKYGIISNSTTVRFECASPNSVHFQRGSGGKVLPGRFHFLGGVARRVRRWNIFFS